MTQDASSIKDYASSEERANRSEMVAMLQSSPIPDDQILANLGLFLESKNLARILFMDFIYRQIIDVQGVVMDLGTRFGHNMALFAAMRGIYEPFNRHRKIIGFDTFTGFPSISAQDGDSDLMVPGRLAVSEDYEQYLSRIMYLHEHANPLAHIKKYEICKGDATEEMEKYFERHPETIVALVYFDFDLYEPTQKCLEMIRPRLAKGSILAFDELNDPDSPGETVALMETFGLNNIRLKRFPYASRVSYFIVE
jgi:hypothetical protein